MSESVSCALLMVQWNGWKTVPIEELKRYGTLWYPVLTDVTISGVPVAWSHFSASNLRTLVLTEHPLENHLSMQTLHGILSNSKETLETLTLKWAIWASNRLLLDCVTLPSIKSLDIGYTHAQEACQVLRMFDFPALRNLRLHSLDDDVDGSEIFTDMMKYLLLEQLEELGLIRVKFPLGDFPDHELVKSGTIAEESLPLLLQFVRRLIRGSINMARLKKVLFSEAIRNRDDGIWQFRHERVKLKVDGEPIGPIIEGMNPYINFCMGIEPNEWWDASLENSLTLNLSWDVSDII
ncbi:hypothetical protein EDD18DRAFT_1108851 [Armillaria luteobubalina]|uniref:Uncharacterized protein n=1 Tax=Armillaria luteobubalina TaxID=153913 RepID=A0AA39TK28_9AGAR|nr:hypothetical protein EDD18DRAFT_1108851 [Armillaria luteobubalina]